VIHHNLFLDAEFSEAIEWYTQAIDVDVEDPKKQAIYYSNRAFAHIKLENYGFAIEDATRAISKDPNFAKGYYRRASAYFALGKYKQAAANFKRVSIGIRLASHHFTRFSIFQGIKMPKKNTNWPLK